MERDRDHSCDDVRELVSAAADGEASPGESDVVDTHLAGCADCRAHAERVAVLTRHVRLRSARPSPELTERVLARARPARLGRGGWMRPALAWVALVLVAQSIGPLVLGSAEGADTHVARHLGAFSAALGVGLLYAAWRPHRAFGLLPFAGALVVTMVVAAGLDVMTGASSLLAEAVHLTEIVGLALLWMISGSPGVHLVPVLAGRVTGRVAGRVTGRVTGRPRRVESRA